MRIVVPFTPYITPETISALFHSNYEAVDVGGNRFAYGQLLCRLWSECQDFTIIEHDVIPHADVFKEFEYCPELWCIFEYYAHDAKGPIDRLVSGSLGCVRFRAELMETLPYLMAEAVQRDMGSGPGHWARLDDAIAAELAPLRPHVHQPPVGHVLRPM